MTTQFGAQLTKWRLAENITRTRPAALRSATALHSFGWRSSECAGSIFDVSSRLCKPAQVGPLSPYLYKIGEIARGSASAQGTITRGGPILRRKRRQCAGKTALPAQGRAKVIIEIKDGLGTKANGIEVTLVDAVQWMQLQSGKAA